MLTAGGRVVAGEGSGGGGFHCAASGQTTSHPMSGPQGNAIWGQSIRVSPQLVHLLSPSLDQLAPWTLFRILFPDSPEHSTHILSKSLFLFSLSFPSCKTGTIIASTALGRFEDSMRAHKKSTSAVPGTQQAHSRYSVTSNSLHRRKY